MKYLRCREVATSSKHLVECQLCGAKKNSTYITVDNVRVCYDCREKDIEAEFVDRER